MWSLIGQKMTLYGHNIGFAFVTEYFFCFFLFFFITLFSKSFYGQTQLFFDQSETKIANFTNYYAPLTNLLTFYVQYTKTLAVKKWLPFEFIWAVYLEYIVTIHFVRLYPNLLTSYVQYTKTLTVKKWLPFELIYAVDLEYIVTTHLVHPYPNLLTLCVQYTKTLAVKKWLPFRP